MELDVLAPGDPRPEVRAALCAWLDLQLSFALRPQDAVRELARGRGPREALRRAGGAAATRAALDSAAAALREAGAVAVPFGAPSYPPRLARLVDAPPLLLVRGDVGALAGPAVAVVGSRAATAYGRGVARHFAAELARQGLLVVSGLATGIDAVAHAAALEAGGRTLAVQACGPEQVYPARHRRLAQQIAASGAVVSEFPPGTAPRPPYFPLRNRLISALSQAVLVVEARERSGSLTTASHAANQGVDVYAVPGPLGSPTSAGTNRLLADGAAVALSPQLIAQDLCTSAGLPRLAPARVRRRDAVSASDGGGRLLAALRDRPLTRDELARRLAIAPQALAPELLELELRGDVVEDRDGRLRPAGLGRP